MKRCILFTQILFILITFRYSTAQEFEQQDFFLSPSDSVQSDTTEIIKSERKYQEADSVNYSAEYIEYIVEKNVLRMYGNAQINYQDMKLKADTIFYNSDTEDLMAKGTPVLWDGDEKVVGDILVYNMDSRKGTILSAYTKYESGFYRSEMMKKVGKKTLKVYDGNYTTCNLKEPHYHFSGDKMKIYTKDKVIVKDIVMYIGEIPVLYFPFWVASIKTGRRSGILMPVIGFESFFDEGMERYMEHLGYYWAINDYSDLTLTADYGEKRGWKFNLHGLYKLRYVLNGNLNLRYERRPISSGGLRKDWDFRLSHSHTIDENTSMRANVHYVTSEQILEESDEIDDRLQNVIESDVFISKRWNSASGNLAFSERRDLKNNINTRTMPSASLNFRQFSILPIGDKDNKFRDLRGSFSTNFKNYRKTSEEGEDVEYISINHSLGISYPLRLSFLNLTPSIRYNENWHSENSPHKRITMSFFNLSSNTKIYGIFNPNIWKIKSMRHTITPSLSYNPFPSYVYTAEGGLLPLMNWNFEQESKTQNKNMPFSINNLFEAKIGKGAEGDSLGNQTERKLEIFRLDFSSSYDFDAKEKPFGNLNSAFRTQPLSNLSFRVSTTHDVYNWELLKLNFDTGFSISGNLGEIDSVYIKSEKTEREKDKIDIAGRTIWDDANFEQGTWDVTSGVGKRAWSLKFDYHYSRGKDRDNAVSNINLSAKFQPTKNWNLNYSTYYNVEDREFTRQRYSVIRNLHCWEGSLNWERYGDYWRYYVIFRVKDLPDIKVEHQERSSP